MASWLVRSSPDQAVEGRALTEDIVFAFFFSTQVYKWVPANLMLGITLRWISIAFRVEC